MKLHLAVQTNNAFGGLTTGTLCGRSSKECADGFNSEIQTASVTCAHCLRIIADPKHWRARKFLNAA